MQCIRIPDRRLLPTVVTATLLSLGACALIPSRLPAEDAPAIAQDAAVPPADGFGVVVGQVFDRASGAPLSGAEVSARDGQSTATSGVDGAFRLVRVPAGPTTVEVSKAGYRTMRLEDVEIRADDSIPITLSLEPTEGGGADSRPGDPDQPSGDVVQMEAFTVVADTQQANTRTAFVALRRYATVSVDTISAAEMTKFVGADISQVMIRLPGISVSSHGAFAVIRGLAERYNVTTLDGIALPSSDPERQSVELDQFPAKLMDGLVVYKNFAPDLPGNLTGGGVEIKPVSFPSKRTLSVSFGVGFEEGVLSGADALTYDAGRSRDWIARGASGRIPTDQALADGREVIYGGDLVDLVPERRPLRSMPRGSLFFGDTFDLPHGRQLGLVFSLSYDSGESAEEGIYGNDVEWSMRPVVDEHGNVSYAPVIGNRPQGGRYHYLRSTTNVLAGGYAGLSFRLDQNNNVGVSVFSSQTGSEFVEHRDDIVSYSEYGRSNSRHILSDPTIDPSTVNRAEVYDFFQEKIRYRERNLTSVLVRGETVFPALNSTTAKWRFSQSTAYQDEPNARTFRYSQPIDQDQYEVSVSTEDGSEAGTGVWRKVKEDVEAGNLDVEVPFDIGRARSRFRIGGAMSRTDRRYREKVSLLALRQTAGGISIAEEPDDFRDLLLESTLTSSDVSVKRDIDAGYWMLSLPVTRALSFDGGIRFEHTKFTSEGFGGYPENGQISSLNIYVNGGNRDRYFYNRHLEQIANGWTDEYAFSAHIDQTDALPAFSATLDVTSDFRLRLSTGKTIARPSLREIGNYFTFDDDGNPYYGNATLQLSSIRNLDLRAEYFFSGTDLVALTLFRKWVDDPIVGGIYVPSALGSSTQRSWFNIPTTVRISGVEFEMRHSLGFLGERWQSLSLGGNATFLKVDGTTFVRFEEGVGPVAVDAATAGFPGTGLYDQPSWLLNLDATYDIERWGLTSTLAYRASDRIFVSKGSTTSGPSSIRGEYVDTNGTLDLTIRKSLGRSTSIKFSAQNLLDPERRLVPDRKQTGDAPVYVKRWHDSRSYSLTMSYEF